ncbi:MAG: SprT-like domain-containing protein [Acidobacteria bacterium]|nr:SprT-like domain-containing protein [Acidobacteriota bacterium]
MINNFLTADTKEIKNFYTKAFQILDPKREIPEVKVEFYPYIGINNTIRVRNGKIFVRLAELCQTAPLEFQKALAFILTAKLLRKKVPPSASQIYRSFIKSQEIQSKAKENKRAKGRKVITTSRGEIYDLEEIFRRLNSIYFKNSIQRPTLTWSARKTFRILGHHDSTHETIVISKSLDDKKVPPYVVEFVVFHEMLHVYHPTLQRDGRHYNHTPQFRRDEKKFAHYATAESWIEQNAKNFKVKSKKAKVKS